MHVPLPALARIVERAPALLGVRPKQILIPNGSRRPLFISTSTPHSGEPTIEVTQYEFRTRTRVSCPWVRFAVSRQQGGHVFAPLELLRSADGQKEHLLLPDGTVDAIAQSEILSFVLSWFELLEQEGYIISFLAHTPKREEIEVPSLARLLARATALLDQDGHEVLLNSEHASQLRVRRTGDHVDGRPLLSVALMTPLQSGECSLAVSSSRDGLCFIPVDATGLSLEQILEAIEVEAFVARQESASRPLHQSSDPPALQS